jgi:hypothetical protein
MLVTRADASSIASGIASRRRQISAICSAFDASSCKLDRVAAARSMKSRTASHAAIASRLDSAADATLNDGTPKSRSPTTPSGSRLVANTRTPAAARRIASAIPAAASRRCSQLSRMINACLPVR